MIAVTIETIDARPLTFTYQWTDDGSDAIEIEPSAVGSVIATLPVENSYPDKKRPMRVVITEPDGFEHVRALVH